MKKYRIIIMTFFILELSLLISNNSASLAFVQKTQYYDTVSYGIAIFLMIWQWLQYIIPFLITIILFIINRKKLSVKKIIVFLLLGLLIFFACYSIGNIIVNNSDYEGYSSTTIDMFTYNGETVYYHK